MDPLEIAKEISNTAKIAFIREAEAKGPYVNFYVDWKSVSSKVLESIDKSYGSKEPTKTALIEHTSINPNASPHVGRARNAIIGDSLARIMRFAGYKTEVHYFVNDVGKQIALLVWAGKGKRMKFGELLTAYIEANKSMEKDKSVEQDVLKLLGKFESGDKSVMKKFKDVVGVSILGQKSILSELNIDYDHFDYESDYIKSKETSDVLEALEKTGKVFKDEEGRKVVKYKDTYFVLTRSDGTSLYMLRDIAYTREKAMKSEGGLNIIVLGEDQKLYFEQLSYLLGLLGIAPPKIVHYSFVLLPGGGKMSTRRGDIVLLDDFMHEAIDKATAETKKRYPKISKKDLESRAKSVATAAVRYSIIRVSPEKNVIFSWHEALRFEGDTGPYLQYTHARAGSILGKAGAPKKPDYSLLKDPREIAVVKLLARFPSIIEKAVAEMKPHYAAGYLHELADSFNEFYQNLPVIRAESPELMQARLGLVAAVKTVMKSGLGLLGIDAPEKM